MNLGEYSILHYSLSLRRIIFKYYLFLERAQNVVRWERRVRWVGSKSMKSKYEVARFFSELQKVRK